jgi:hypothetical protein
MYQEVVRTDKEIDDLRNKIGEQKMKGGSKFSGMTYEEGLDTAIEWLLYRDETDDFCPMEG